MSIFKSPKCLTVKYPYRVTDTSLSKDIKITHITCMHSSTLLKGMFPLAHTGEVEE